MLCPVCSDPLAEKAIPTKGGGVLNLQACQTCGGIWTDHGVANRLTPKQAEAVASHLKNTPGMKLTDPVCTRCGLAMKKINIASVPPDVTAYACPNCQANWFPAGELSRLRKAQWLKLEYLKAFNIPFASFSSVLLPIVIISLLGLSAIFTAQKLNQPVKTTTLAEEPVRDLQVSPLTSDAVKITFFTKQPARSFLKFVINGESGRLTISNQPGRYHEIQVSGVKPGDLFQISLEPESGQPFSTEPKPFIQ